MSQSCSGAGIEPGEAAITSGTAFVRANNFMGLVPHSDQSLADHRLWRIPHEAGQRVATAGDATDRVAAARARRIGGIQHAEAAQAGPYRAGPSVTIIPAGTRRVNGRLTDGRYARPHHQEGDAALPAHVRHRSCRAHLASRIEPQGKTRDALVVRPRFWSWLVL